MGLPFGIGGAMFTDRAEAGRLLAARLVKYKGSDPVVLAIPRGGVAVALEVARALDAPLDIVVPRKIGAPGNPELALGAVAANGEVIVNERVRSEFAVSDAYIEEEAARQREEIARRERLYRGGRSPIPLKDRVAIIVDDGLATGFTAIAASRAARAAEPKKLVLAVPVAPPESCERLATEADEVLCMETPEMFFAVGQFYADFDQVEDGQVIEVLRAYAEERGEG